MVEVKFEGVNRYKTVWVARITGQDEKYGFKREFIGRRWWVSQCYYSFEATIKEPGVYEIKEPGSHKHSQRRYIAIKNNGEILELGCVAEGRPIADIKAKILEAL